MDWKSKLIYYYMVSKTNILIWYSTLRRIFSDTRKITANSNDGNKSIYYRYFVIRGLVYLINGLKYVASLVDVNVKKIEITKDYKDGEVTAILDGGKDGDKTISIYETIHHVNKNHEDGDNPNNKVFLKLMLKDQNNVHCLKDYMIKYRDDGENHHNTLENIVDMNDIEVCEETSKIDMVFFNKGKRQSSTIPYKECKDQHINYFNKIEK